MSEAQLKKKRKKRQLLAVVEQEEQEIQNAMLVTEALEELKKQGKKLDIQVCPKCKSPKVRRSASQSNDLWSHMGLTQPKYECQDCGWQSSLTLKATNKATNAKDMELIAEAHDLADDESK